jgi:hypothetical protein
MCKKLSSLSFSLSLSLESVKQGGQELELMLSPLSLAVSFKDER